MVAPRVFAGMFVALVVFAIATYWMNGSLFVTFLEVVAAAILLQMGYFLGIGFLVWKQARRAATAQKRDASDGVDTARDDSHGRLPGAPLNRSGPLSR